LNFEGGTNPMPTPEKNKIYEQIAKLIRTWADGKNRPLNGSYVLIKSIKNGLTTEYL